MKYANKNICRAILPSQHYKPEGTTGQLILHYHRILRSYRSVDLGMTMSIFAAAGALLFL